MSAWTCRRLCNGARHELSSAGRTSPCGFLLAKIKVSVRMKKGDAKGKRHHSSYFFFMLVWVSRATVANRLACMATRGGLWTFLIGDNGYTNYNNNSCKFILIIQITRNNYNNFKTPPGHPSAIQSPICINSDKKITPATNSSPECMQPAMPHNGEHLSAAVHCFRVQFVHPRD